MGLIIHHTKNDVCVICRYTALLINAPSFWKGNPPSEGHHLHSKEGVNNPRSKRKTLSHLEPNNVQPQGVNKLYIFYGVGTSGRKILRRGIILNALLCSVCSHIDPEEWHWQTDRHIPTSCQWGIPSSKESAATPFHGGLMYVQSTLEQNENCQTKQCLYLHKHNEIY